MNKFLTYPGGQPIFLGDITFLDNAYRDALKNIVTGLTGNSAANAILSGTISKSGNLLSWTALVIAFKGEIFYVQAGSLASSLSSYYVTVNTSTPDEDGERQFENGVQYNVYEYRTAAITSLNVSGSLPLTDFIDLTEALAERLSPFFRKKVDWKLLSEGLSKYPNMTSRLEVGYDGQFTYLRGHYDVIASTTLTTDSTWGDIVLDAFELNDVSQSEYGFITDLGIFATTFNVTFCANYKAQSPRLLAIRFMNGGSCNASGSCNMNGALVAAAVTGTPVLQAGTSASFCIMLNAMPQ